MTVGLDVDMHRERDEVTRMRMRMRWCMSMLVVSLEIPLNEILFVQSQVSCYSRKLENFHVSADMHQMGMLHVLKIFSIPQD